MICFRDQSFCLESKQCGNTGCHARWTQELSIAAARWWGAEDAPVAFMPMKDKCNEFMEKHDAE